MSKRWRPSLPTEAVAALNEDAEHNRRELADLGLPDRPMYYDRDGNPIGLGDWAEANNDLDYKRVARTFVGAVEVSTVWLGLDHGLMGDRPLIFETMCFTWVGGDRAISDDYMERYSTEQEALEGHDRIVARIKARVA